MLFQVKAAFQVLVWFHVEVVFHVQFSRVFKSPLLANAFSASSNVIFVFHELKTTSLFHVFICKLYSEFAVVHIKEILNIALSQRKTDNFFMNY